MTNKKDPLVDIYSLKDHLLSRPRYLVFAVVDGESTQGISHAAYFLRLLSLQSFIFPSWSIRE
jgi:hypothetical protein